MTDPDGTVVLDCVVIVPTVRPAFVIAVDAAACVNPTTFGTDTAPVDTTRSTLTSNAVSVFAAGVWLITEPAGTVRLEACVTVPTVRPAAVVAAVAAVRVMPTTFGTTITTSIVTLALALLNATRSTGVNTVDNV